MSFQLQRYLQILMFNKTNLCNLKNNYDVVGVPT